LKLDWLFKANREKAAMMKNTDAEPAQCSFGIFYLELSSRENLVQEQKCTNRKWFASSFGI